MKESQKNKVILYIDNALDSDDVAKSLIKSFGENDYLNMVFRTRPNMRLIANNSSIISMIIMDWELWDRPILV